MGGVKFNMISTTTIMRMAVRTTVEHRFSNKRTLFIDIFSILAIGFLIFH